MWSGCYGVDSGRADLDASYSYLAVSIIPRHEATNHLYKEDLPHWGTLEEQIHARSTHNNETGRHAGVYHPLNPFLSMSNTDQCKANGALDSDECKAPGLLEYIEPEQSVHGLIVSH